MIHLDVLDAGDSERMTQPDQTILDLIFWFYSSHGKGILCLMRWRQDSKTGTERERGGIPWSLLLWRNKGDSSEFSLSHRLLYQNMRRQWNKAAEWSQLRVDLSSNVSALRGKMQSLWRNKVLLFSARSLIDHRRFDDENRLTKGSTKNKRGSKLLRVNEMSFGAYMNHEAKLPRNWCNLQKMNFEVFRNRFVQLTYRRWISGIRKSMRRSYVAGSWWRQDDRRYPREKAKQPGVSQVGVFAATIMSRSHVAIGKGENRQCFPRAIGTSGAKWNVRRDRRLSFVDFGYRWWTYRQRHSIEYLPTTFHESLSREPRTIFTAPVHFLFANLSALLRRVVVWCVAKSRWGFGMKALQEFDCTQFCSIETDTESMQQRRGILILKQYDFLTVASQCRTQVAFFPWWEWKCTFLRVQPWLLRSSSKMDRFKHCTSKEQDRAPNKRGILQCNSVVQRSWVGAVLHSMKGHKRRLTILRTKFYLRLLRKIHSMRWYQREHER